MGSASASTSGSIDATPTGAGAERLLHRLRERGLRITPQRRAVVQSLSGEHVHLTAEQIHASARALVPEVSLATVYNTLNELVSMGEITELHVGDGSARYDPKVGPDHHHLICTGCGLMFDVEPSGMAGLGLASDQQHGMQVETVEVTFRGLCPDCQRQ